MASPKKSDVVLRFLTIFNVSYETLKISGYMFKRRISDFKMRIDNR